MSGYRTLIAGLSRLPRGENQIAQQLIAMDTRALPKQVIMPTTTNTAGLSGRPGACTSSPSRQSAAPTNAPTRS